MKLVLKHVGKGPLNLYPCQRHESQDLIGVSLTATRLTRQLHGESTEYFEDRHYQSYNNLIDGNHSTIQKTTVTADTLKVHKWVLKR